jgi:hypothetical protein
VIHVIINQENSVDECAWLADIRALWWRYARHVAPMLLAQTVCQRYDTPDEMWTLSVVMSEN